MKWWMYMLIAVVGFSGILTKYPEQLGRTVSNLLVKKLGRVGGRRVEKVIHRVVDAFQLGLRYDNGGTDEEVADSSKPTGKSIARNKRKGTGWGR